MRALLIGASFLLAALCGLSRAQGPTSITSDGTLNTTVIQNGNVFNINDGTIKGRNQFHSFERFSVGAGDIASFNGPGGIENILGRVTGGLGSDINGTLRSTIDGANLFLLNPAGVVFGPNASLDISGSFFVSTADFLRLGDDGIFYADPTKDSLLTMAPPSAFGFLGKNPAGITIEQSELKVPGGRTLSAVGGDINIRSGNLFARPGRVNLVSVGSPGEVHVDDPGLNVDAFNELGNVNLVDATVESQTVVIRDGRLAVVQGRVQATGAQARIDIAARGEAVLGQGAALLAEAKSAGQKDGLAGEADDGDMADTSHITLSARDDIQVAPDARISAGGSQGGRVQLASDTGTTWVAGTVEAPGTATRGGEVHILGEHVGMSAGASVDVSGATGGGTVLVGGDFQGGNPDIKNATVTYMEPGATITADARSHGDGGTAIVWADHTARVHGTITARGGVRGGDGGMIETSGKRHLDVALIKVDASAPLGSPGTWLLDPLDVEISADPTMNVDEAPGPPKLFTPNDSGVSKIRNTDIEAGLNTGTSVAISTVDTPVSSNPPGQKGDIVIAASIQKTGGGIATLALDAAHDIIMDNEKIKGSGLNIVFDAGSRVVLKNDAIIDTSTAGSDRGGDITINATAVDLQSSTIDTGTFGAGAAGEVTIRAKEELTIAGSKIFSDSPEDMSGNAGDILISAPVLTLSNTEVTTKVAGTGEGGIITIEAGEQIRLENATVSATVNNGGDGFRGDILLTTPSLTMIGGRVAAETTGTRDAGIITLKADIVNIDSEGSISARTFGAGKAGDIELMVAELTLRGDSDIDSSTFGSGSAGNVTITATEEVTITERSTIFSNTDIDEDAGFVGTGDAGNIVINAPMLSLLEEGSIVSTTCVGCPGQGGNIEVSVEEMTLEGGSKIDTGTFGTGAAGTVTITAEKKMTIAGSKIFSDSPDDTKNGDAGDILITAPVLTFSDAEVTTLVAGTGQGGIITIDASEEIRLENATVSATVADGREGDSGDILLTTPALTMIGGRVAAETTGERQGGIIALKVGTLNMSTPAGQKQAQISSSSTGAATGDAGTVAIWGMDGETTMADTVLLTNSAVTTEADVADGGNITILADSEVRLRDSKITTAVRSGKGGGGNIFIDPDFVILEGFSQIIANAFGGPGGNINIIGDAFLRDIEKSTVSASSVLGVDGQINIDAITDLSGAITPLQQRFSQAAALLRQRCAERLRGGQVSSFIVGGRDGVPLEPGEVLPSPLFMVEQETVTAGNGGRLARAPGSRYRFIGFDDQGHPSIRGWPMPGFSQVLLDLECAEFTGQ